MGNYIRKPEIREFKFRAWDSQTFEMDYSDEWTTEGDYYTGLGAFFDNFYGCEFQQFTGLLDCHRKEIYEGDIVRAINGQIIAAEVRYHEGAFWFHDIETEETKHFGDNYGEICHWSHNRIAIEVIGNIYENPELRQKILIEKDLTNKPQSKN